jgi:hypothetical protein
VQPSSGAYGRKSMTLTLDKDSSKATLQHKILLWNKKPVEFALSEIDDMR